MRPVRCLLRRHVYQSTDSVIVCRRCGRYQDPLVAAVEARAPLHYPGAVAPKD